MTNDRFSDQAGTTLDDVELPAEDLADLAAARIDVIELARALVDHQDAIHHSADYLTLFGNDLAALIAAITKHYDTERRVTRSWCRRIRR